MKCTYSKANVANSSDSCGEKTNREADKEFYLDAHFLWCCFCTAASDIWPCRISLRCLSTSPSIRAKAWFPTWPRSDSRLSSSESSSQTGTQIIDLKNCVDICIIDNVSAVYSWIRRHWGRDCSGLLVFNPTCNVLRMSSHLVCAPAGTSVCIHQPVFIGPH